MKRERDQAEVDVFKARFRRNTLQQLELKLAFGYLTKPARIAIRQLIEEKSSVELASEYSGDDIIGLQRETCSRIGAEYLAAPPELKLGAAIRTLCLFPINGLRHPPTGETTGWFIWGGGELSTDPQFFQPLHVGHVPEHCPDAVPYLGLAPGWRFLIAPEQEDVWFDGTLLEV